MHVFSGLVYTSYCVTYFVFRRNIRGYEFTLTIERRIINVKCVDVTFQIDKIILRKGFGSSIVLQNNKVCSIKQLCSVYTTYFL